MKKIILAMAFALLLSFAAFPAMAEPTSVNCVRPEGDRMDFDVPSSKFVYKHVPAEAGSGLSLAFSEDGTRADLTWTRTDAKTKQATKIQGSLMRFRSDAESVDYVGDVNGVSVLITYYQKEKAVVYSEHGYTRNDPKRTAKGKIYSLTCK